MSRLRVSLFAVFTSLLRSVLLVGGLMLLGVAWAGGAWAHSAVVSIDPADGAVLDQAPKQVRVVLNEQVIATSVAGELNGPDGATPAPANVDGATVTFAMPAVMPSGSYRFTWRLASADGHVISQDSRFTVTAANAPSGPSPSGPSPSGQSAAATSRSISATNVTRSQTPSAATVSTSAASAGQSGSGIGLAGLGLAAAVLAGIALAWQYRRGRQTRISAEDRP